MALKLTLQSFIKLDSSSIFQRVSTAEGNIQANGTNVEPVVSADGRYLFFVSTASNLVTGDTNNRGDVFRKDLATGAVVLVSSNSASGGANAESSTVDASENGQYVVFESPAANLAGGTDTNGVYDVFRKDLLSGETVRVSQGADNVAVGGTGWGISADGRYVVFSTPEPNLVPGNDTNLWDIYRKDMSNGSIVRVSQKADGTQADGFVSDARISADGRYVTFKTFASNLVPNDTNGNEDIFRKDLDSGEIVRISTTSSGGQADGGVGSYSLSANGRYLVFSSSATNLVANDTNGKADIFRKDLVTGEVVLVSVAPDGAQANNRSIKPQISTDGRYVSFVSDASNLVPGDVDPEPAIPSRDIFRKDLVTGAIIRIPNVREDHALGGDGQYVFVSSSATNWVSGDTNDADDVVRVTADKMPEWPAIAAGRAVKLQLATGTATSASMSWGDGTIDQAMPVSGSASFNHVYATTGIKKAVGKVVQGDTSWAIPYVVDLAVGTMARDAVRMDMVTGGRLKEQLLGDSYANHILGNGGNDIIMGLAGHDRLQGGLANDVLTGGKGKDIFVFNTKLGTAKTDRKVNFDTIKDFVVKDDTIWLDNAVFKKLGKGTEKKPGKLNKAFFKFSDQVQDKDDYLIYNKKTGVLSYDADGNGAKEGIEIAQLKKGLKMTVADFFVV